MMDRGKALTKQPKLTDRQRYIAVCFARGFTAKEIARKLGNSPRTIEVHRAGMMEKFEASNICNLVALLVCHGHISVGEVEGWVSLPKVEFGK